MLPKKKASWHARVYARALNAKIKVPARSNASNIKETILLIHLSPAYNHIPIIEFKVCLNGN
jgi:hypothetical protein